MTKCKIRNLVASEHPSRSAQQDQIVSSDALLTAVSVVREYVLDSRWSAVRRFDY